MTLKKRMVVIPAAIASLVACSGGGGGGNDNGATQGQVTLQAAEQTASQSIGGLVQFTETIVGTPAAAAESEQPINIDALTPQTSESAYPTPVQ
jgi:hypothetical protein